MQNPFAMGTPMGQQSAPGPMGTPNAMGPSPMMQPILGLHDPKGPPVGPLGLGGVRRRALSRSLQIVY